MNTIGMNGITSHNHITIAGSDIRSDWSVDISRSCNVLKISHSEIRAHDERLIYTIADDKLVVELSE
jgi:hypothetical protein